MVCVRSRLSPASGGPLPTTPTAPGGVCTVVWSKTASFFFPRTHWKKKKRPQSQITFSGPRGKLLALLDAKENKCGQENFGPNFQ